MSSELARAWAKGAKASRRDEARTSPPSSVDDDRLGEEESDDHEVARANERRRRDSHDDSDGGGGGAVAATLRRHFRTRRTAREIKALSRRPPRWQQGRCLVDLLRAYRRVNNRLRQQGAQRADLRLGRQRQRVQVQVGFTQMVQ